MVVVTLPPQKRARNHPSTGAVLVEGRHICKSDRLSWVTLGSAGWSVSCCCWGQTYVALGDVDAEHKRLGH